LQATQKTIWLFYSKTTPGDSMKKLIFIIIITASILSAEELTHSLGMSAGYISGSGISYRQMREKIGYQIAGGVIYNYEPDIDNPELDNEYLGANISGTFYYLLHNKKTTRFYLLGGTTIFRVFEKGIDDDEWFNPETGFWEIKKSPTINEIYINIGIGLGLEFPLTKYLHMSLEWPWYYDDKIEFIKFIPQAGVHYYFK